MANISAYHGEVSACSCGIYEHPERTGERACRACFNRGFVAVCTACDGQGQIEQKMAGGPGTMKATCSLCGGGGRYGVNKPADWDETHPKELAVPEQEAAVA
jgi:hypothetical protein